MMSSESEATSCSNSDSYSEDLDAFQILVRELSDILGPSCGLDSTEIDPLALQMLMGEYISRKSEWIRYAFSDRNKAFTRNLVHRGNGKSNLVRQHE